MAQRKVADTIQSISNKSKKMYFDIWYKINNTYTDINIPVWTYQQPGRETKQQVWPAPCITLWYITGLSADSETTWLQDCISNIINSAEMCQNIRAICSIIHSSFTLKSVILYLKTLPEHLLHRNHDLIISSWKFKTEL